MRDYWKRASELAARQAAVALGLTSREQIVIRAVLALVAVGGLAYWGSADAWSDGSIEKLLLIAAIVLLFPIVFLWKLVNAPVELDREQKARIATLSEARSAKPRLTIKAPIIVTRGGLQTICMEIENNTGGTLEKCSVKLIDMTGLPKSENDFVREMPIWLLSRDQNGGTSEKHFMLFSGEKVVVDFGYLDLKGDRTNITFQFREWGLKLPSEKPYGLKIGVYSEKSDAEEVFFTVAKVGEHLAFDRVS